MTKNLYHVQDSDRPMYVIAPDWQRALDSWRAVIRKENADDPLDEPINPDGIALVADGGDIVEQFEMLEIPMVGGAGDGGTQRVPLTHIQKEIQVMAPATATATRYTLAYVPIEDLPREKTESPRHGKETT